MTTDLIGVEPILPAAEMHLVRPTAPVVGRVVENRLCMKGKSASFVRHVTIDVSGTPLEGHFRVGQSFGVIPPGVGPTGKPHAVRLYSISCPSWGEDGHGRIIATTPKRLIDERAPQNDADDPLDHSLFLGVCSNYLCNLRPGDDVLLSGPAGKRFLLPVDTASHHYLFVATGTGIAPFRGMVRELLDRPEGPVKSDIHLVMGTPYTSDLLYDDEFTVWNERHDNFHYHPVISREPLHGRSRGEYVDQYIERNLPTTFGELLARPNTLLYMCGLIGMQFGMYQLLQRNDLGPGYILINDDYTHTNIEDWDQAGMRRYIRPTSRCMLEVY
jgi:ferredoxin--NADP+ reductase